MGAEHNHAWQGQHLAASKQCVQPEQPTAICPMRPRLGCLRARLAAAGPKFATLGPLPPQLDVKVLSFESHDAAAALTRWRLADVRANRTGGKGRGLSRKQRDTLFELPLSAIRRVNLHIDF